jgi:excinuclease ABC subunit A
MGMERTDQNISISNARQNNLKNISLSLPKNKFIVVTGVSGSGKSTLAFDVIHGEGRRKYLENLNIQARKLLGKLEKPKVDSIINLSPTLALSQQRFGNNPRSTVGTLTEIYDHLRLLFARIGKTEFPTLEINQSLFSFNSPLGACKNCNGLGVEDKIDPNLLLEDKNKSIRDRCFKITNPKGYIIYSQVTIDALNEVCKAHGFNVDIPWKDLTPEQQHIVLNGSEKIKIPYGKHTLESRMKWSGITAKPREEGFYKGILPVMDQILKRDRNPNILRFAKSQICSHCNGSRLTEEALSVKIDNKSIDEFAKLSLLKLKAQLLKIKHAEKEQLIAQKILKAVFERIDVLSNLGLSYLSLNRNSETLSGGELQRIQLSKLLSSKLRNIIFIFDEPSIGIHPSNKNELIKVIRQLVNNGNTAIVVEHDADTIWHADWIVEIGPGPGIHGGEIIFNGLASAFFKKEIPSITKDFLTGQKGIDFNHFPKLPFQYLKVTDATINNLKAISPKFLVNGLNVVTGVSGAGKSSLIKQTLIPVFSGKYESQLNASGDPGLSENEFKQLIYVDRSPIGKTARSTPATYTKLFDLIRDFFASLEKSKERKFSKSTFSFNVAGGRCETCEGAGKLEVGMHFLGNVERHCPDCEGKRFKKEVLEIKYHEKNISDILDLSVKQAKDFFHDKAKIRHHLNVLISIGLGYLKLGQSSGSLSGGEAQRIKLATEIIKSKAGNKLYIFDEPTTGLHFSDINVLMKLFENLLKNGNTIIAIEHNTDFIQKANHIIDLGPGSAEKGGQIVFEGSIEALKKSKESITAKYLEHDLHLACGPDQTLQSEIAFTGITTHNLKSIDINIPENKHIVITGKSGSGKSSLAFDTIFAEAQNRFIESFPSYVRRFAGKMSQAKFETVQGLTPAIAIKQGGKISDPRSTLGTLTEIFDLYRLLFARFGKSENERPLTYKASLFSFNNAEGSCQKCSGLGTILTSNISVLLEDPVKSIEKGGLINHKSLRFYTDPFGQYMATLYSVGRGLKIDFHKAIKDLNEKEIEIALFGTGNKIYDVDWNFNRKGRTGSHNFKGEWKGFINLILEEYYRKDANNKGEDIKKLLVEETCPECIGQRFRKEILAVKFSGLSIHEMVELSVLKSINHFKELYRNPTAFGLDKNFATDQVQILTNIIDKLESLESLGLDYLHMNRRSNTLSGGELQRVLLSTHLKGGLCGLTYILDEPSTGLHPVDTKKLNSAIQQIIREGNTVITVEHNPEVIKKSDFLLEIGPGAGKNGGRITQFGKTSELLRHSAALSKSFNQGFSIQPIVAAEENNVISIFEASANNLKKISFDLRLNQLNVISGVSGSGKTSLMRDVLIPSYKHHKPYNCSRIETLEGIQFIKWIDKNSLTGSMQSTPATYMGIFDQIRKLFAKSKHAKTQNLKTSDFSFNSKSGQCPVCKGRGTTTIALDFISDIESVCESCNGSRFTSLILKFKWNGLNISEILGLTVQDALHFFSEEKSILSSLQLLDTLGLGYLRLDQTTKQISGGESQRLKIAKSIQSTEMKKGIFIFDEPSRGLHPSDIPFLKNLLKILLKNQNTVVVIEHNPQIIGWANHVIDLGPGGGDFGGKLIYQGTPAKLTSCKDSKTGKIFNHQETPS